MTSYTFSQLIDFTRTSAATYVNSTGNIVSTPASVNLLTFTQEFANAAWTKSNANAYPFDPATASVGANVVTNGDFASGTGWTANAGWVIGSGVATATATSGSLYGGFTSVSGQWYKITFDCTITSGTLSVAVGLGTSASFTTSGTKTVFLQSGASTSRGVEFYGGAVTGTVDNVVAQPVTIGLLAPDGTLTADTLVETAATSGHVVSSGVTVTTSAHVFSVYLKKGSGSTAPNWLQLYTGGVSAQYANFNLGTGAVGSVAAGSTATITSVGNGWYRCTLTFTPSSGGTASAAIAFTNNTDTTTRGLSYAGATTSDVLAWGAQLELGSTATTYTRNFGGLLPARFDYDPVTLAPRGLLIEEQRTNLLTYSEQFDNASWSKVGTTATANTTESPDGTADADSITATGGSAQHYINQSLSFTSGTAYTLSVFAKKNTLNGVQLTFGSGAFSTLPYANFDLNAGTSFTSNCTATMTDFGNGWYRCTMTATATSTASTTGVIGLARDTTESRLSSFDSDGNGIFIWGAQLEAGAFATSYIPTVASQVTRSRDEASINAPNFASWYNSVEGTLLVEGSVLSTAGGGQCPTAGFDDGTASNRYIFFKGTGTAALTAYVNANATGNLMTLTANTPFKAALAFNSTGIAACANGGSVSTASGTTTGINRLSMGQNIGSISVLPGHVRSVRFYPTRLTNAQLQALTA